MQFWLSKTVFSAIFHNILFQIQHLFSSKFCLLTLKKPSFSQCIFDKSKSIDTSQNRNNHVHLTYTSNEKLNEFSYYLCFLDKVDFDCAWLWCCLVWELSEINVMTMYKLSNKQKNLLWNRVTLIDFRGFSKALKICYFRQAPATECKAIW